MNLSLLISAKKQIFAYFQYLVCLNKVLQSLNVHIPCQGKVTKLITSNYIFPNKNFNPILSNTNYSFRAYHVSLNLMSHDIDIISADISNFGDLAIFVMSKDFLNWKWCDFLTSFSLCCKLSHFAVQFSNYHLNYLCKVNVCCIFMIFIKVLHERSCQLLLS